MTKREFMDLIESKIVIVDGATGSNLQKRGMPSGVCPEKWMIENPQAVIDLQREFLEAGSDIIFAPTFTANRIKLKEYGLADQVEALNRKLIGLSQEAVMSYQKNRNSDQKVYIAGDLTMTGEQVYPVGDLKFEELVKVYKEQLGYQLAEGIDLVVVETMMSLQECRAALLAVKERCDLPVIVSLTFQENKRTLFGTDPKTAVIVLQSMGVDAIGVNCSTGPDKMHEIIREMKEYAHIPIMAKPNAGIPQLIDGETIFPMGAEEFALEMEKLVEEGAAIVGGCCGSTPEHIRRLSKQVENKKTHRIPRTHVRALTTEKNTREIDLSGSFMVIGERINPTGKKQMQDELREGKLSLVLKMAQEQKELGADILDINLGMSGIDEKEMMIQVMEEALRTTELPLCIDTSNPDVMEAALRLYPGRALINSISLEKDKSERLLPLAKKYGAMFILLPVSEKGLPKNIEEKKEIITTLLDRAYKVGLTKEDIIIDGLVVTVGANPKAAIETIETIRFCKEELGIATVVGLSNISFGLPMRQYINSTFLSFAIQAGLTMAIANPSQELLMNTALAADLLCGKEDSAGRYIEKSVKVSQKDEEKAKNIRVDQGKSKEEESKKPGEAIFEAVVKGNRKEIIDLVKEDLENGYQAADIIDQFLIPAINEVGQLYDQQIYFLPQLIAGAEAMKKAIEFLEPMIERTSDENKGTVVIATVAGDIHDIGKNLVSLMLKNYGYRVIDLGKDVPTDTILKTAKEEDADIIAVSALMTTTMVEMKRIVQMAREQGLRAKVIIGGAVITQGYANEIGADGYSKDAQSAVGLVERLVKKQKDE